MTDYQRHRFQVTLNLAYGGEPRIAVHASVYHGVDRGWSTVFLGMRDASDAEATILLTVEQADRTGRALLEVAERTRATPAPRGKHETSRVAPVQAWPAAEEEVVPSDVAREDGDG